MCTADPLLPHRARVLTLACDTAHRDPPATAAVRDDPTVQSAGFLFQPAPGTDLGPFNVLAVRAESMAEGLGIQPGDWFDVISVHGAGVDGVDLVLSTSSTCKSPGLCSLFFSFFLFFSLLLTMEGAPLVSARPPPSA